MYFYFKFTIYLYFFLIKGYKCTNALIKNVAIFALLHLCLHVCTYMYSNSDVILDSICIGIAELQG